MASTQPQATGSPLTSPPVPIVVPKRSNLKFTPQLPHSVRVNDSGDLLWFPYDRTSQGYLAVFHQDIRRELYDNAARLGSYDDEDADKAVEDRMSFMADYAGIQADDRSTWPAKLLQFSLEDEDLKLHERQLWTINGFLILNKEGMPMIRRYRIPDTVSNDVSGMLLECFVRMDKLSIREVVDRMPPSGRATPHSLTERASVFRRTYGLKAWSFTVQAYYMDYLFERRLSAADRANNTVRHASKLTGEEALLLEIWRTRGEERKERVRQRYRVRFGVEPEAMPAEPATAEKLWAQERVDTSIKVALEKSLFSCDSSPELIARNAKQRLAERVPGILGAPQQTTPLPRLPDTPGQAPDIRSPSKLLTQETPRRGGSSSARSTERPRDSRPQDLLSQQFPESPTQQEVDYEPRPYTGLGIPRTTRQTNPAPASPSPLNEASLEPTQAETPEITYRSLRQALEGWEPQTVLSMYQDGTFDFIPEQDRWHVIFGHQSGNGDLQGYFGPALDLDTPLNFEGQLWVAALYL